MIEFNRSNREMFDNFIKSTKRQRTVSFMGKASYFLPGLFLIAIGVLALIAPRFLGAMIAFLFLFLGFAFLLMTWKLTKFFKNVDSVVKGINKNIVVRSFTVSPKQGEAQDSEDIDGKKIIIH